MTDKESILFVTTILFVVGVVLVVANRKVADGMRRFADKSMRESSDLNSVERTLIRFVFHNPRANLAVAVTGFSGILSALSILLFVIFVMPE